MVSKRSDCHTPENHSVAGDEDIYQVIIKIDADCKCVKVYHVYHVDKAMSLRT